MSKTLLVSFSNLKRDFNSISGTSDIKLCGFLVGFKTLFSENHSEMVRVSVSSMLTTVHPC